MFLRDKDKYGNISERLVKVHKDFRVIAIGIPVPVINYSYLFMLLLSFYISLFNSF